MKPVETPPVHTTFDHLLVTAIRMTGEQTDHHASLFVFEVEETLIAMTFRVNQTV